MALTKSEWETAMAMVEAALLTEIPAAGAFQGKPPLTYTKNTSSQEVPDNHPAGDNAPRTAADNPNDTEIPADGGFAGKPRIALPDAPHVQEIPDNHPAGSGTSITPADWKAKAAARAAVDFGVDTATAWQGAKQPGNGPTGSPDYSGATAKGWSDGKNLNKSTALPLPGATKSVSYAPGSAEGSSLSFEPDDPKGFAHSNPTPRSSMASVEDPTYAGNWNSPSLPDGTFCLVQPGDVAAAVGKVLTAEQMYPPKAGRYQEVKRHIAQRAQALGVDHMVPADWQLSMAMLAEAEMARKFSADDRARLAKAGKAMPGGGYPIETAGDLKNAMEAFGREPDAKRSALKAHIARQARALGASKDVLARIAGLGKSGSK